MNDDDLKILGKAVPPPVREGARDAAVFAAMGAFDEAQAKKESSATQENGSTERPTSITNSLWRTIMTSVFEPIWNMKPATMAAVSGVVMVPLAGVAVWNIYGDVAVTEPAAVTQSAKRVPANEVLSDAERSIGALVSPKPLKPEAEAPVSVSPRKQAQRLQETQGVRVQQSFSRKEKRHAQSVVKDTGSALLIAPALPQKSEERYTEFESNAVKSVAQQPVSTFSIDVDTASYSRVRRALLNGNLPPKDMVRVEEMINYFNYAYPLPEDKTQPFKPSITIMPTPWNEHTNLLHIGIKGYDVAPVERPKANLVFLLDVSGSMNAPDKLPLLVKSFRLLLQKLNPEDTVSIVTYAGRAATVLEPTPVSSQNKIFDALGSLSAGGSTGGAQGIERAYQLAQKSFVKGGVNRVMLATDGDFNVGISDPRHLKDFIAEKRKSGIFLSVFGFGRGNYNDALMQSLAQNGNGTAAYIDTLAEAQKTLVEEAGATLFPIATDVKIQMEFNPAKIAEYRLVGYETRALKQEDFNNDKVDAGDIGSGHSVTAIYEVTPVGSPAVLNEPLRYGEKKPATVAKPSDELGFLKMRYKLPGESKSKLLTTAINPAPKQQTVSVDVNFATAVAAFGQKLRSNTATDAMSYADIAALATAARGEDKFGYRSAFVQLVRMAGSLAQSTRTPNK